MTAPELREAAQAVVDAWRDEGFGRVGSVPQTSLAINVLDLRLRNLLPAAPAAPEPRVMPRDVLREALDSIPRPLGCRCVACERLDQVRWELSLAAVPSESEPLNSTNATKREWLAYNRGQHRTGIDGSHIKESPDG